MGSLEQQEPSRTRRISQGRAWSQWDLLPKPALTAQEHPMAADELATHHSCTQQAVALYIPLIRPLEQISSEQMTLPSLLLFLCAALTCSCVLALLGI